MKKKIFLLVLTVSLLIPLISAGENLTIGYVDVTIPDVIIELPEVVINFSLVAVNHSNSTEYWLTNEGVMDNVADIKGSDINNDLIWITAADLPLQLWNNVSGQITNNADQVVNMTDSVIMGDEDSDYHTINTNLDNNIMLNTKFRNETDNFPMTGIRFDIDYTGDVTGGQSDHEILDGFLRVTGEVGQEEGFATNIVYGSKMSLISTSDISVAGEGPAGQQRLLASTPRVTFAGTIGKGFSSFGSYTGYNVFAQNEFLGLLNGTFSSATQYNYFATLSGNMGPGIVGTSTKYSISTSTRGTADTLYGQFKTIIPEATTNWHDWNDGQADIANDADNIREYDGEAQDCYRTFTGDSWDYACEIGNPVMNISGVEKVDIHTDVNVDGNFTGNQIYGEMWNRTDAATPNLMPIDAVGVYYNITNLSANMLNGFNFTSNNQSTGGSFLTAQISGRYKASASISMIVGVATGDVYGFAISHEFRRENHNNCYSRRSAVNQLGNVGITCLIDIQAGTPVNLQVEQETGGVARDISFSTINMNLVRIGDIP